MSKSFLNKIELKNKKTATIREIYSNLIQYAIKKGNKNTIENILLKMLFNIKKKKLTNNVLTFDGILKAFENITPVVGIKTKRKGSKNIYIPIALTKNRSRYLASNWLIENALLKQNKSFQENLAEELFESSLKKSNSFKKYYDLQKLAESSTNNLKSKLK